ncbi:GYP8 [Mytilus edulis]|uniref:TBC1 domain family member 20 n=1 Tax=Mytilus edulis TaxID=6550 RepID=A0A8S3RFZ3_MYTED|nr:GYP8 [Mytilus edulis]
MKTEKTNIETTDEMKRKIELIKEALSDEDTHISTYQKFAISYGGLVNNDIRSKVWPKLLEADISDISPKPESSVLEGHRDYNQVVMDVNRTLKRFPPGMDDDVRLALQDQLIDLIMRVLVNHEELHYYQGYHDICVTILLVVGDDVGFALMDILSLNHLRDFMDSNMDRTKHMLNYLYPIVGRSNPELRDFMERSEVGTIFSLSWLITWFGHVLDDIRHIVRLYDFFIANHGLMPIYLAAAIVLYRKEEILASECEMCVLHCLLSKIPDNLPYEKLISDAGDLFLQYPPTQLANEALLAYKKKNDAIKGRRVQKQKENLKAKRYHLSKLFTQNGSNVLVKVTMWTFVALMTAGMWAIINTYREFD